MTPDRRVLVLSILLQLALGLVFGHSYDTRVFMATGYLVGSGHDPYVALNLSRVFHHAGFSVINSVGYPPPWPLLLGLIYRGFYAVGHGFLLYNLAIKIPVIAANVGLAYLVGAILQRSRRLADGRPQGVDVPAPEPVSPLRRRRLGRDRRHRHVARAGGSRAARRPAPRRFGAPAGPRHLRQAHRAGAAARRLHLACRHVRLEGSALRGGVPCRGAPALRRALLPVRLEPGAVHAATERPPRHAGGALVHDRRQALSRPPPDAGQMVAPGSALGPRAGDRHDCPQTGRRRLRGPSQEVRRAHPDRVSHT